MLLFHEPIKKPHLSAPLDQIICLFFKIGPDLTTYLKNKSNTCLGPCILNKKKSRKKSHQISSTSVHFNNNVLPNFLLTLSTNVLLVDQIMSSKCFPPRNVGAVI